MAKTLSQKGRLIMIGLLIIGIASMTMAFGYMMAGRYLLSMIFTIPVFTLTLMGRRWFD